MRVLTVIDLIRELNKYESHVMVLVKIDEKDGVHTRTIEGLEYNDTDYGEVIILN